MRMNLILPATLIVSLLCTAEGQTQTGGPGGDPRGSRGGGRGTGRGGPGGGGGFPGGSSFSSGDPSQFFNQMTNGRDVWLRLTYKPFS